MAPDPIVSTGRGGAGNIGADSTVYTDGAIVREGPAGISALPNEADYSTGRGGHGNISVPSSGGSRSNSKPRPLSGAHAQETASRVVGSRRTDEDVVPEPALREDEYSRFHTGRGGEGNKHKQKYGGHSSAKDQARSGESVGDKVKNLLGIDKDKEKSKGAAVEK